MSIEVAPQEMYQTLTEIDERIHHILAGLEVKKKAPSLQELQDTIRKVTPINLEDSTLLIRQQRAKKYD